MQMLKSCPVEEGKMQGGTVHTFGAILCVRRYSQIFSLFIFFSQQLHELSVNVHI
jgi:hypothetical protein